MKQLSIYIGLMIISLSLNSQSISINNNESLPDPNAILDIKSGTKGKLIPRTSGATRITFAAVKGR